MRSYIWWIAVKQVFSTDKKAGLVFMTLASMLGVMIGVAALVVTLSVMGGFEHELRQRLFVDVPHLEVVSHPMNMGISMKEYPLAYFHEKIPEAIAIAPFIRLDVILKHEHRLAAIKLFGIDPVMSDDIWRFDHTIKNTPLEKQLSRDGNIPSLLLGAELAAVLELEVGDVVDVLSSRGSLSGFLSGQKWFHAFRVEGIFHTQQEKYSKEYAVTHLSDARQYMQDYDAYVDEEEYVSGIAIRFAHENDVDRISSHALPKIFDTLSWKDVNRSLLFALMLEKFAMGVVLFLIILVAAFSLSGTVMMTVYYKKTQISLLRGLGIPWQDVVKIFIAHGVVIGLAGVISGCIAGLVLCIIIQDVGMIHLPEGIFALQKLPVKFLYRDYIIICLCALALTIIASVYPAYIAGKQDPGDALR